MVYTIVLAFAPPGVSQNSQFFLPTVTGRMLFSLVYFAHKPLNKIEIWEKDSALQAVPV
jgi:hypothetical protein